MEPRNLPTARVTDAIGAAAHAPGTYYRVDEDSRPTQFQVDIRGASWRWMRLNIEDERAARHGAGPGGSMAG